MNYTSLFFDADGTIFDYERAERMALEATFHELLPGSAMDELVSSYRQHNLTLWRQYENQEIGQEELRTERFNRLFRDVGIKGMSTMEISERYLAALSRQAHLLPDAREVLSHLSKRYRLALITNGIAFVQRSRMELAGISGFFRAVVISEEAGFTKPDPRIFTQALHACEATAAETLMIGDSVSSDGMAAHHAGMDFCHVTNDGDSGEGSHITWRIASLSELLPVLASGEIA